MISKLPITRIVVTHRSTPVRYAHRVLELAQGKLQTMTLRLAAVS